MRASCASALAAAAAAAATTAALWRVEEVHISQAMKLSSDYQLLEAELCKEANALVNIVAVPYQLLVALLLIYTRETTLYN
jgi:hypothetical protein